MSPSDFFAGSLPRTFGHRGAAGTVPENTRPSFAAALEHGAAGLELDVHATADGEIVVVHDDLLDRTTDGIGPVRARTLEQLRLLDAGARFSRDGGASFPFAGRGIGISTLREVLEDHPETPFIVEIKQVDPPLEADLARLLQSMGADGRTLVFSLHQEAVDRYRALGTGRPTGFGPADVAEFLGRLEADDWEGYVPPGAALAVPTHWEDRLLVSRPFVDAAHRLGLEVFVWTVNDPAEMEALLDLGVDGLISDHPELLTRVVAERADRTGETMTGGTVPDERTLLAALDVVDVALALVGTDKRIQYANAAYGEFVTHSPAAIEGTSIFGLGCPCDGLAGLEDEWDRRDFMSVTGESPEGSIVDVVVRPLGPDSEVRLVLVRRGMVRNLASRQLPSDVVSHIQEFLVELTGHGGDPTTLAAAPLSILLLGIEDLEGLRREHGDDTVEAVLRQVAQALVLQKRKADIIGRYRDGQFLVIAPDTPRHGAVMLAERIRRRVESLEFESHGHAVPISIATYAAEYRPSLDGTIREAVERGVATISAPAGEPSA